MSPALRLARALVDREVLVLVSYLPRRGLLLYRLYCVAFGSDMAKNILVNIQRCQEKHEQPLHVFVVRESTSNV